MAERQFAKPEPKRAKSATAATKRDEKKATKRAAVAAKLSARDKQVEKKHTCYVGHVLHPVRVVPVKGRAHMEWHCSCVMRSV